MQDHSFGTKAHQGALVTPDMAETASWMPLTPARDETAIPAHLQVQSLTELESLVAREINHQCYPARSWTLPRTAPDGGTALDVLIVGGSQAGLAVAHQLQMTNIRNIAVIEAAPEGKAGPWSTYARMATLRTHKDNGGIEAGIPSLSLRAWYEAQHGAGSWAALYKVKTADWAAYLDWFRKTAGLEVSYDTALVDFDHSPCGLIAAQLTTPDGPRTVYTRKLVLATGIEGNGKRSLPPMIGPEIPTNLYAHTQDPIDFATLKTATVAVLGGGASAYDNAILAAEAGATVHIFHRMEKLTSVNPGTWGEFEGYLRHYITLPPAEKWRYQKTFGTIKGGPPVATINRALALPNLTIHPACTWNEVAAVGDQLVIEATDGRYLADFAILGTGYRTDLTAVPYLAHKADQIALWADMFTPPADLPGNGLEKSPWLAEDFTFQPKPGAAASWHRHVLNFSRGAQLSTGTMAIGLSGIKFGASEVARALGRAFFHEDSTPYLQGLLSWQNRDLAALDT